MTRKFRRFSLNWCEGQLEKAAHPGPFANNFDFLDVNCRLIKTHRPQLRISSAESKYGDRRATSDEFAGLRWTCFVSAAVSNHYLEIP